MTKGYREMVVKSSEIQNIDETEQTQKEERKLTHRARELLNASDEERIRYVKLGVYIDYRVAAEITQEIMDLFDQPIRPRMEGLLLYGKTGNGKTTLVERIIQIYNPKIDGIMVRVQTPERVTLKEFYAETLVKLGYPIRITRSTGDLRRKILQALKDRKVKMIFFDEIHNLLDSRRDHKKDILNGLKSLNNQAQIPIVLVGIGTAVQILGLDAQVADRYPPLELPLWEYNKEFKDLLATFEVHLPLKNASNLHFKKISGRIYQLSEGKLGRVAKIIRKSAIKAIRNGTECITLKIINSIKWRWDEQIITANENSD